MLELTERRFPVLLHLHVFGCIQKNRFTPKYYVATHETENRTMPKVLAMLNDFLIDQMYDGERKDLAEKCAKNVRTWIDHNINDMMEDSDYQNMADLDAAAEKAETQPESLLADQEEHESDVNLEVQRVCLHRVAGGAELLSVVTREGRVMTAEEMKSRGSAGAQEGGEGEDDAADSGGRKGDTRSVVVLMEDEDEDTGEVEEVEEWGEDSMPR